MGWDLTLWLHQHKENVEQRWLLAVQELPAYASLPANEKLSHWHPLFEALLLDRDEKLAAGVQQWASRETMERQATPSELLSISAGLPQAIHDLLPGEGIDQVNGRLYALDMALARHFASEAERLANEKAQLETLHEITRELNASLDLDRVLHKTLNSIVTAINGEMGVVFLVESQVGKVTPKTTVNWNSDSTGIPLTMLPSEWQLGRTDTPLVLNDAHTQREEAWVEALLSSNMRSAMVAPLIANGAFLGLLVVAHSRPNTFNAMHVQLFNGVLSQIATAIGNAEVYHLITQQAQELGQMLRHQQEESTKSQAILASIGDGVVVNSADGQTILINPAAGRILDKRGKDLVGQDFKTLFSFFDERGREEAIGAMETLLGASSLEMHKAFKMILEVDSHIIHAHLSPVLTMRGDFLGVVTVLRDVTKEVEADRAKSEFVSTVSHELRTPMTAIKGYTDLLHAGAVGPINDQQKRFLGIISNNADRLTALINDLLDISRVDAGRVRFEPKPVQIGEIVADVVNALAVQAESKQQTLTYEVVGGLPDVIGDRDRLNQVVTNLVGNAVRYTPAGGEIEVRVYSVQGAVRVDVRDSGIGIAPDDLGRIFERFYRADHPLVQEASGTGLGLAISRTFVEMHGGRMWVESEPDHGSTFTFILPLRVQDEGDGQDEERRPSPRVMARTRTILIVEDDPDTANLVKKQLEDNGYRVSVLGRGGPVVSRVETKQPDLIVLDLILPDKGGLEVLKDLKGNAATADVPVIVLSIAQDDGTTWNVGAVDYLTKPVQGDELLQSVERALTWQGRVLVVEDDPDTVGLLSATMRQIGFTPLVAANGYEALALARRYRPDLILLDLRLPGMDGYESLTHLKRDIVTQTIPIITVSAHVSNAEQERNRLIALGATSFLPKPFSVEDLLAEVETALQPVPGPIPV